MSSNTNSPQKRLNAVVVGGSIAGLMCGIVLQNAKHNVTILERHHAVDFNDYGAGMGMRAEVADFINTYVKTSAPVVEIANAAAYTLLKADGSIEEVFPLPSETKGTSWREIVRVLSETFDRNAAAQRSATSVYKFGCQVNSIVENGTKVSVTYQQVQSKGAEAVTRVMEDVDLVVGGDGANSTVRRLMMGDIKRSNPGYLIVRVRSVEAKARAETRELYGKTAVVQCGPGRTSISYAVPAKDTSTGPLDLSLIQYRRFLKNELETIFTDVDGKKHTYAVPQGKLSKAADTLLRNDMATFLAPQIQEIVDGCDGLLVQMAADLTIEKRAFLGGKVLLVSDAAGLARPHVFAGTSKAAFDALKLEDLLGGIIDVEKWEQITMLYATTCIEASIEMGDILLDQGNEEPASRFKRQSMILVRQSATCAALRVQA